MAFGDKIRQFLESTVAELGGRSKRQRSRATTKRSPYHRSRSVWMEPLEERALLDASGGDVLFADGSGSVAGPVVMEANEAPSAFAFTFAQAMDTDSFSLEDIEQFWGPDLAQVDMRGRASGFDWLDDRTLTISTPGLSTAGVYRMTLAAAGLLDASGAALTESPSSQVFIAPDPADMHAGLIGEYWDDMAGLNHKYVDYGAIAPAHVEIESMIDLEDAAFSTRWAQLSNSFAARWSGWIKIDTPGDVEFFVNSDEGNRLSIDGQVVLEDWSEVGERETSGRITLAEGYHYIELEYYENSGTCGISLSYTPVGGERQLVPASVLFHDYLSTSESVLTVTSAADSGPGSLREALALAQFAKNDVTIEFAIPTDDPAFVDVDSHLEGGDVAADVFHIDLNSQLPALGNSHYSITLDASTQTVFSGDTNPFGPEVTLDGNDGSRVCGLLVTSDGNRIGGFNIQHCDWDGVKISYGSDNLVTGCYIGTDATGTESQRNTAHGILIRGGSDNTVGGTEQSERNLISANTARGVHVGALSTGNAILGNYIGTDYDGSSPLPNDSEGVRVAEGQENTIDGNVILAGRNGIWAKGRVSVQDNAIIRDPDRTDGEYSAIALLSGSGSVVANNSIEGHFGGGIEIGDSGSSASLSSIYQWKEADGGNGHYYAFGQFGSWRQIEAHAEASDSTLATITSQDEQDFIENVVIAQSGQRQFFIGAVDENQDNQYEWVTGEPWEYENWVSGQPSTLSAQYAWIGWTSDHKWDDVGGSTQKLGLYEFESGISLKQIQNALRITVHENEVGAKLDGSDLAGDIQSGIAVFAGSPKVDVQQNAINTVGPGIDLWGDGVTTNDHPVDVDSGPNGLQNYPILASQTTGNSTQVVGFLKSTPQTTFTVDVYASEFDSAQDRRLGQRWLGAFEVTTDAEGYVAFDETLAVATNSTELLTATTTGPEGTSEFSPCSLFSNENPVAHAGGPYTPNEKTGFTLDASGSSDPNGDDTIVTYEWDLDYDGQTFDVDATGQQPFLAYDNPFAERTIAVRVTDDHGEVSTATTTLEVLEAPPTVFWVSTLLDELDNDYSEGDFSLREAIALAHDKVTYPGEVQIEFAACLGLDTTPGAIDLTLGQLEINAPYLTIAGPGPEQLTIDAVGQSRVMLIGDGDISSGVSTDVTIAGVTLTGGQTSTDGAYSLDQSGGGIWSNAALSLHEVTVAGNSASGYGGGVYSSFSTLRVANSTIFDNSAAYGGGIYCRISSGTNSLTLTHSTLSGNSASWDGGGIYSHISSETAGLTIGNSTFVDNSAGSSGGGIYSFTNSSTVVPTVTRSTFSGNSASTGGGIFNRYGAFVVTQSTICGNSASTGGGIYSSSTLTVIQSTISGNSSESCGGGIYNYDGTLTVTQSTISGNSAESSGGGVFSVLAGALTLSNTVITLNRAPIDSDMHGECDSTYSLIGFDPGFVTAPSAGIDGEWGTEDDIAGDFRLASNSIAIDHGDNELAEDMSGNPLTTDLDGNPRVVNGTVDIGAYEYQSSVIHETASTVVTTLSDLVDPTDHLTSLREAIFYVSVGATTGSEVTLSNALFSGVPTRITLSEGQLVINTDLTITGPGAEQLAVDAEQKSRVFYVMGDSIDATLYGLTITGGQTTGCGGGVYLRSGTLAVIQSTIGGNLAEESSGGGIYNYDGTLTVTQSTISGNSAESSGGGIYNDNGTLTATHSTISGNSAESYGGGIYNNDGTLTVTQLTINGNSSESYGGGIFDNSGAVTVTESTIFGNSGSSGGGIFISSSGVTAGSSGTASLVVTNSTFITNSARGSGGGIFSSGTLDVTNSTFSDNSASGDGGGIASHGALTLNNTVLAYNIAPGSPEIYHSPNSSADGSHNLIADGAEQTAFQHGESGNLVGIDPLLSDPILFDDGIWGRLLLPDSPALDAGSNALAVGPDGSPLTQDICGNDRIQNGTVDIGAIEGPTPGGPAATYVVTSLENTTAADGVLTFFEAFEAANRNRPVGDAPAGSFSEQDIIQFASGLNGTVSLNGTELKIRGDLSIEGPGFELLTISGGGTSRVFAIAGSTEVSLSKMTVTDGVGNQRGGAIHNQGTLHINNVTITGNSAHDGGGIYNDSGTLCVENSTVSGNSADDGSGIYNNGGSLSVANSTISSNVANMNSGGGGGIRNESGATTISDSTIAGNGANAGGGIYHKSGYLTITSSKLTDNAARSSWGGGMYTDSGVVSIASSTISRNSECGIRNNRATITVAESTVSNNGGGGGSGIANGGTLTITNSTISGNSAENMFTGGGGISSSGTLTVICSRIFSNSASGWYCASGGGINNSGTLTVTNSMIFDNSVWYWGGQGDGGGIYTGGSSASATISNTIVTGNSASNGSSPDICHESGTLTGSHNLIGNTGGQLVFYAGVNGNLVGADPYLSEKTQLPNGQWGYLPMLGSPLIDAGSNESAVDPDGLPLETDLNGRQRIIGDAVDIGPFESSVTDFFVTGSSPSLITPDNNGQITVTFSRAVDPDFVSNAAFRILGLTDEIPVTGVDLAADARSATVHFEPITSSGEYQFVVMPTLRDTLGIFLNQDWDFLPGELEADQYAAELFADISTMLSWGHYPYQETSAPLQQWTFHFSRKLDPASVSEDTVLAFTGPDGSDLLDQVEAVSVDGRNLTVQFFPQNENGTYTIRLSNSIQSENGAPVDQNENSVAGEPEDEIVATINVCTTDLAVVGVSDLPASTLGDPVTIEWTVTNVGSDPMNAGWTDYVYLSADTSWSLDDPLIGRRQHDPVTDGSLAPGATYDASFTAAIPPTLPGDYYVLVVSRSPLDANTSNSTGVSTNPAAVSIAPLALGVTTTGTVQYGQPLYYQLDVTDTNTGSGVVVGFSIDDPGALGVGLYVSQDALPTPTQNFASRVNFDRPAQRLWIPDLSPGTYFVSAIAFGNADSTTGYRVTPELVDGMTVLDAYFGQGGTAGNRTIEIRGVDFDRTVTAALTNDSDVTLPAIDYYRVDESTLYATFDLREKPAGTYDVLFENASGELVTIEEGFEVVATSEIPEVVPQITAPPAFRRVFHTPLMHFPVTIHWSNNSLNDACVPIIQFSGNEVFGEDLDAMLDFLESDPTMNGRWHTPVIQQKPGVAEKMVTFIGTAGDGPPGVLLPGQGSSVTYHIVPKLQQHVGDQENIGYFLDVLYGGPSEPIDWQEMRELLPSFGLSEQEQGQLFEQLKQQVGRVNRDFRQMISRNLNLLPYAQAESAEITTLLRLEAERALAELGNAIVGRLDYPDFSVDIGGIEIIAKNTSSGDEFRTWSYEDGSFVLSCLTAGEYHLAATLGAFTQEPGVAVIVSPDTIIRDVLVPVVPAIDASILVQDSALMPIANARIRLLSRDQQIFTETTTQDGEIVIPGLRTCFEIQF